MYFPKSQIIENLHTNGGELKDPNSSTDYVGYYFKTSDGEFYSGKNPEDKPNTPLILLSPGTSKLSDPTKNPKNNKTNIPSSPDSEPVGENMYLIDVDYYTAKSYGNRGDAPRPPIKHLEVPTEEDYNNGGFKRYFVKKGNENQYIEISKDEFKKFDQKSSDVQYNLYVPISINWNLTGTEEEVYNSNKAIVSLVEQRRSLPGFILSFRGKFSKYWRS